MMQTKADKLKAMVARWGLAKTAFAVSVRLLRSWFFICQVRSRPTLTTGDGSPLPEGVEIRKPTRAELDIASVEMPDQLTKEFIDNALKRGDICTAAFVDGSIVSFAWTSFGTTEGQGPLLVHIRPSYHYGYKSYTRPEYRGLRITQHVTLFNNKRCQQRGCKYSITYIEPANFASLANSKRLGSRVVGFAGYLTLFGLYYTFRTPGAKQHGFRFSIANAKPAIS